MDYTRFVVHTLPMGRMALTVRIAFMGFISLVTHTFRVECTRILIRTPTMDFILELATSDW